MFLINEAAVVASERDKQKLAPRERKSLGTSIEPTLLCVSLVSETAAELRKEV